MGKVCTLVGCTDGPQATVNLHRPMDEILDSTITACLNDACSSGKPRDTLLPSTVDASDRPRLVRYAGGSIGDRGEGWTSVGLNIPSGSFSSGDRYRVAITTADGVPVLDVERRILYAISSPNGPDCDSRCSVASTTFYEGSEPGLTCTGGWCMTSVTAKMQVEVTAASMRGILTVCRNAICATADKALVQRELTLQGELRATLSSLPRDDVFHISLRMAPEAAALVHGDVYRVRIVDPQTGTVLAASEKHVTYDAVFPNGAACDTHPCRTAVIDFD